MVTIIIVGNGGESEPEKRPTGKIFQQRRHGMPLTALTLTHRHTRAYLPHRPPFYPVGPILPASFDLPVPGTSVPWTPWPLLRCCGHCTCTSSFLALPWHLGLAISASDPCSDSPPPHSELIFWNTVHAGTGYCTPLTPAWWMGLRLAEGKPDPVSGRKDEALASGRLYAWHAGELGQRLWGVPSGCRTSRVIMRCYTGNGWGQLALLVWMRRGRWTKKTWTAKGLLEIR